MQGYRKWKFEASLRGGEKVTHDIYEKGDGPVVMIMQELPGIGPETLRLADKFCDEGFTVVLPHLFGPLGKVAVGGNTVRVMCMRKHFRVFEKGESSPIVDWMRALCQRLRDDKKVKGVAVIGMCLTGNFAISLMADDAVLAATASQPSLPIYGMSDLHMSEQDVNEIKAGLDKKGPMLAFRFEKDVLCQAEKFESLDKAFNEGKERIRMRTLPGRGHAVLTIDFVDHDGHPTKDSFEEVLLYFRSALSGV